MDTASPSLARAASNERSRSSTWCVLLPRIDTSQRALCFLVIRERRVVCDGRAPKRFIRLGIEISMCLRRIDGSTRDTRCVDGVGYDAAMSFA